MPLVSLHYLSMQFESGLISSPEKHFSGNKAKYFLDINTTPKYCEPYMYAAQLFGIN